MEPRCNDPRYNDIPGITMNILCSGKSYSKMYGTEPRYNDLRYNNCRIPRHIESVTEKRWLRGTWYAVRTECKTGSYSFPWLRGTRCLMNMQNGCQVLRGFRGSYAYVISLKMKYLVATFKEREIMLRLSRF